MIFGLTKFGHWDHSTRIIAGNLLWPVIETQKSHMQSCIAAMAWYASLWPYHNTNLSLNLLKRREKGQIFTSLYAQGTISFPWLMWEILNPHTSFWFAILMFFICKVSPSFDKYQLKNEAFERNVGLLRGGCLPSLVSPDSIFEVLHFYASFIASTFIFLPLMDICMSKCEKNMTNTSSQAGYSILRCQ